MDRQMNAWLDNGSAHSFAFVSLKTVSVFVRLHDPHEWMALDHSCSSSRGSFPGCLSMPPSSSGDQAGFGCQNLIRKGPAKGPVPWHSAAGCAGCSLPPPPCRRRLQLPIKLFQ